MSIIGVKALVERGISEIPENYIKPPSLRLNEAEICTLEDIPIVDISQLQGEQRNRIIRIIVDAAENWGFFQIVNHGVSPALMKSMMAVGHEFFNLPLEDKMTHHSEDFMNPMRSLSPCYEQHFQWHDHLLHRFPPHGDNHPWPENPSSYKSIAQEYVKEVSALARQIIAALSEGLGLDANYLDKSLGHHSMFLKLGYYPECPNPELAMGQDEHTDIGCITMVMQDEVGGLQAKHGNSWYPVKPLPDAFVVNIADQLQIFSNGRYKSARHRVVVNSKKSRMSVATFFDPSSDVVVSPIPELISDEHPPIYKGCLYEDYVRQGFTTYIYESKLKSLMI